MLENCLKEIKKDPGIPSLNEEDAKRMIILRILSLLGWDIYSSEIKEEYGVGTRRVDYLLQVDKNKVFVEAKKPEEDLDNHQKQLLDYSFQEGVALAILTNGIQWWFYLPLKQGAWSDRRFDTIDILAQDEGIIADKFDLLLSRQNIGSGQAVQHAESILERSQKEKALEENLPKAWNRIIKESEPLLVDLLRETTEEICGFRLEAGDVREVEQFILDHREKWILSSEQPAKKSNAKTRNETNGWRVPKGRMQIDDVHCELAYVFEILINTANWLIDKGKLKSSDCPINVSRGTRRVLINSKPVHPSGQEFTSSKELTNGLYIECHGNRETIINLSKKLLAEYGYDPEVLRVHL